MSSFEFEVDECVDTAGIPARVGQSPGDGGFPSPQTLGRGGARCCGNHGRGRGTGKRLAGSKGIWSSVDAGEPQQTGLRES